MNTYDRLDNVRMSTIDREHAKAHMRSAEVTIDFVAAAVATIALITTAVWQRVTSLARRTQIANRQAAQ